jgi:CelD/BcsL family acetyltransferase involved in cellulose biosynthesis
VFEVFIEQGFNFLSREYAELFGASRATAFQHPLWLNRLYATLTKQVDAEPLIVVVRSAPDGRLAMVLPLVRQRHGIMRVVEFADLRVSDYASPICSDETFALILRDMKTCEQIRQALQPFDLLRIKKLREGTLALEQLLGVPARESMNMSAHAVALRGPFSEWRAGNLNPSYRKELDKKSRQLRRKGVVRFECSQDPDAIRSTFTSMQEHRRPRFQGRGDGDLLQKSLYFQFYVDVAIAGRDGFARTYTLSMDGTPIAGVLGLSHNGNFLVILGGFDQAGYKSQSIGSLMFEEIARDCIERGDTVLDFTIGDEPYKGLFGAQPLSMWMISRAGSPLGSLAGFIVEQAPWVKNMARMLIHQRPLRSKAPLPGDAPSVEAPSINRT